MDYTSVCFLIFISTAMLATSAVLNRNSNRSAFTPIRCDRVPFTQRTGNQLRAFQDAEVNQCFPIVNTNVPTEVFLHHERSNISGCSHAVLSYTKADCEESVGRFSLSFGQTPIVLNERKPICSFRLRYIPLTNDPITVKFGGGYGVAEMTQTTNECYNVCGQDGQDTRWPTWIGVYDSSRNVVTQSDNYISLFSKNECDDESILLCQRGN